MSQPHYTKHTALIFLLFCLFRLPAVAQQKLSFTGTVIDASTGETLQGAVVKLMDHDQTWSVTNEQGRFRLQLPPNIYRVELSYIGFETSSFTLPLRNSKDTVIVLSPSSYNLQALTILAETQTTRLRNPEMSIERVNTEIIKRVPTLFGEIDILKVVQLLPGVQAASEGTSGFNVRGGSPDQNMILFDRAPLYNASHMLGFLSVFNNDAVSGMSLYKGDIPAQYGGRLSSLLEVDPKDGDQDFSLNGGIGLISSKIAVQGKIGTPRLTYLVAGRRTYADLFLPLAKEEMIKNTTINFYDLNGRLHWLIDDKNTLNLTLYNGRDRFAVTGAGVDFGNTAGSLNWRHTFSPRLFLRTYATFTHYGYVFDASTNGLDMSWHSSIDDAGWRADFSFIPTRFFKIDFGYTGNLQFFKPGTAVGSTNAFGSNGTTIEQDITMSAKQSMVNTLYFSNQHQFFGEIVRLRYGLRLNRFDNIGPTTYYPVDKNYELLTPEGIQVPKGSFYYHEWGWEPRVGLSVLVHPNVSIKAAYARTLQYVHLMSFSSAGSPLEIWIPSGPTIPTQVSQQVSLGAFATLWDHKWEASVELFYKYLDNVLDFKEHPNLMLYDKVETELRYGTGRSYGIEWLLRKNEGKINGWISYTFSRSFRTIDGVNNGDPYRAPSDRPHNINFVGLYTISPRVSASLNWIYATGAPLTLAEGRYWFYNELIPVYKGRNTYRAPDFHRMDVGVTVKLGNLARRWKHELNVSVYNVYGRKNPWAINYRLRGSGEQYMEMTYLFSVVPSISYNFSF